MRVLIIDMGSKMNRFGGEARVAAQLHSKLKRYFETFYLGYETPYLEKKNTFIIEREKLKFSKTMRTGLSESWIMRAGYYFLAGRMHNIGISKDEIKNVFDKVKPDIVISNSLADFPILRYAKKFYSFKSIYIDHVNLSGETFSKFFSKNSLPFTLGTGMFGTSIASMKKKFFSFFDANVALNLEQKEKMEKLTEKVVYIPNGIAKPKKDRKARIRFLERFALNGKFVYLFVGRMFERQKNVSTLIRAFKELKNENIALALVGEGPSLGEYLKIAKGDKRIIFTGPLDDNMLNGAYSASSVFILPSFWEGFSITMLEASSHGLPIIISKPANPSDFRKEGIRLLTFDPRNYKELKSKMELILEPKIYESAKKESEKIAKRFSEARMINDYRELILRLSGA